MKRKLSLLSICIPLVVFFLIFAGIKFTTSKNHSIKVGFYNISEVQEKAFTDCISAICLDKKINVSFFTVTPDLYSNQIQKNKIDLIICAAGYALKNSTASAQKDVNISNEVIGGMYSSMREAIIAFHGKNKAVPLIVDNLEIDIDISEFKMSGMERIATWKDIEQLAKKVLNKEFEPISFAGAEPVFLLDLLGGIGEAFDGYDGYNKATEILAKASVKAKSSPDSFDATVLVKSLFLDEDAPLPSSLYYLKQLINKGLISKASKDLVHNDINSFVIYRLTSIFFTTLSLHRGYNEKAISRYSSIFFPSKLSPSGRHFTANSTFAVPLKSDDKVYSIIEALLSAEYQENLCQKTGLAPVLANCRVPDKQSDDVRYWIASTNAPVAGLGHEAYFTPDQLQKIRSVIDEYLFY
ncbi:hypothetical protein [Treponema sp. C6A8]|uniref:hypothetical protein n=1 Tax=Treponema sp. C6A8 TaxID=1410609 RepID=UPI0004835FA1|nr:hypothetical protein [Treponema sp. C6A8]